jgi:hypothetical protein
MIDYILKEKNANCCFTLCHRKGAYVLVECLNGPDSGTAILYAECKKHFIETLDMSNWSNQAKAQFEAIKTNMQRGTNTHENLQTQGKR